MKLKIQAGTTSRIIRVFIRDSTSTTGAGLTGLVHNSAGLTAYYSRVGASTATVISLANPTVGSWLSGGFKEVDATNMPGVYELHLPDVAIAAGATAVHIMLKGAANMVPTPVEIELDTINYQANNGILPVDLQTIKTQSVTCAGGVTVPAATLASTTNITAGTITTVSGNVNGNVSGNVSGTVGSVTGAVGSVTGAVGSVTGNVGGNVIGSTGSVAGAVGSVTGSVGGDVQGKVLGGGSSTITGDGVRASSVTGAVGSVTGAVGSVTGSVGSVVGAVGSVTSGVTIAGTLTSLDAIWNKIKAWLGLLAGKTTDLVTLAEIQGTNAGVNYNNTTDSLEAIRDRGDSAWLTGSGGGGGDCPTEDDIADAVVTRLAGEPITVSVIGPALPGARHMLTRGAAYTEALGNPVQQRILKTEFPAISGASSIEYRLLVLTEPSTDTVTVSGSVIDDDTHWIFSADVQSTDTAQLPIGTGTAQFWAVDADTDNDQLISEAKLTVSRGNAVEGP